MRWLSFLVLCVWACGGAMAQALPNHIDPSAREEVPDLSTVPAIRFLTSTDYPPFNFRDTDGRLIGFHVDLANAICDTLEAVCTLQAWPWDQIADALGDNQGDALIAGLAIDEITGDRFDFSNIYLMFPARFVMQSSNGQGAVSVPAQGNVSVRENSTHAQFLTTYLPDLKQVPFETEIAALKAVQDGEVDAYFGDALRASFWLNENIECCSFAGDAYFNTKYFGEGLAIALPTNRGAVRRAINYALQRLKRTGKLDELYLRWFPVSFY